MKSGSIGFCPSTGFEEDDVYPALETLPVMASLEPALDRASRMGDKAPPPPPPPIFFK